MRNSAEHVKEAASSRAANKLLPGEARPRIMAHFRELASRETLRADKSFAGIATNEQLTGRKESDKTKSSSLQGLMRQLLSFPPSHDASYINIQNKHLLWRLYPTLAIN